MTDLGLPDIAEATPAQFLSAWAKLFNSVKQAEAIEFFEPLIDKAPQIAMGCDPTVYAMQHRHGVPGMPSWV